MCITLHISTLHFIYHFIAQSLRLCNTSQPALVLQVWITLYHQHIFLPYCLLSFSGHFWHFSLRQCQFNQLVPAAHPQRGWNSCPWPGLGWHSDLDWESDLQFFFWAIFKWGGRKSISWYCCQTWKLILPLPQWWGEWASLTLKSSTLTATLTHSKLHSHCPYCPRWQIRKRLRKEEQACVFPLGLNIVICVS